MPRPKKGKRLGGSPEHQRKILSNLTADLIRYEQVTTTHAKAKVLRPFAEKMITKARRGDLHARRTVLRKIPNNDAVK
jgi:large subunit ribosomal protein L17